MIFWAGRVGRNQPVAVAIDADFVDAVAVEITGNRSIAGLAEILFHVTIVQLAVAVDVDRPEAVAKDGDRIDAVAVEIAGHRDATLGA